MMSKKIKFDIPCYMIETKSLEKFLEEKAEEGYFPISIDTDFRYAVFAAGKPEKRHYCVDIYRKEMVDRDLKSNEFLEYQDLCEKNGWIYCCYIENLVIFFSTEAERPVELQTDMELAAETLKRVTLKAEKDFLHGQLKGMAALIGLMAIIYAVLMLDRIYGTAKDYRMTGTLIYSAYVIVMGMLPIAVYYGGYRRLEYSLNELGQLPGRRSFWNWENIRLAAFSLLGLVMFLIYFIFPPRLPGIGYAGSMVIFLFACCNLIRNWNSEKGAAHTARGRNMGRKNMNLLYIAFFVMWIAAH